MTGIPDEPPAWSIRAAEALYHEMESIDGEAMTQGQIDQDAESERFTWTRRVAGIIADEFARSNKSMIRGEG